MRQKHPALLLIETTVSAVLPDPYCLTDVQKYADSLKLLCGFMAQNRTSSPIFPRSFHRGERGEGKSAKRYRGASTNHFVKVVMESARSPHNHVCIRTKFKNLTEVDDDAERICTATLINTNAV